jgi:CHAT domain-containing protein
VAFERTHQIFVRGNLRECQEEAGRQYRKWQPSSPKWSWKFRVLEADAALWRGLYDEVLKLLNQAPRSPSEPDLTIPTLTLTGVAQAHLHRFDEAERLFDEADHLCSVSFDMACGAVSRARGVLAIQQRHLPEARQYFEQSLAFARMHGDQFLEASNLVNLGDTAILEEHFDEAVDRSEDAQKASAALGARDLSLTATGNLGWAYYKLGDGDRALALFLDAEERAYELGDIVEGAAYLTDAGYVYMDSHDLVRAERSFQQALHLVQQINSQEDIYNADRVLARLYLQIDDLPKASQYADQALTSSRESKSRVDELYPILVQGQVAARHGNAAEAEHSFRDVEHDPHCPVFLKWEAQHLLARLYENQNASVDADREYRSALATFEGARAIVQNEDAQVSFLTNAVHIYDDYIHFLVAQGKPDEALRWADYNRARTLSQGLGLLPKKSENAPEAGAPALNALRVSQRAKGTLLFYWLGEKQSYLWVVTPKKISLFPLPSGTEIDAMVERYRRALNGPQDALASANEDGRALYRMLVAPAQAVLPKDGKVFVIPDGRLNNLNFETLVVEEPTPHYWIEDATIATANSLRLLAVEQSRDAVNAGNLLLIGNSVAPNNKYPELPKASEQMNSVAGHFPAARQKILTREQATPVAYLTSHPEQFSVIHFVAHGTASRLSPLDSAIVLSKAGAENDSFKLYARDIIRRPIRADLVTISACYGAGERAYSGEGLVGLSWAFLRAGAHNVIAALWEATDVSTQQLMGRFYDELSKGATPDAALRTAKLALLRDSAFRNPFYWAPFQLYTRS